MITNYHQGAWRVHLPKIVRRRKINRKGDNGEGKMRIPILTASIQNA
jgi:hypothetical protein